MQDKGYHLIAREGWLVILGLALLALICKVYLGLLPFIFTTVLILVACFIFRDPKPLIPSAPLAVVSPTSGKILGIDTYDDTWLSRTALRVRVKTSIWDIHTLRSPAEGKVINEWSSPCNDNGYNRRYTYWIKTDEGDDVVMSLLLGPWALFVRTLMHAGERTGQGQRCGFLYFTGIVEILMPKNSRILLKQGEYVNSGASILGEFIHEDGASVFW